MGEKDNLRIVQQAYEAFGRGDLPAMLALLTEDVEWQHPEIENVPWAVSVRGKDAVSGFFAAIAKSVDIEKFEPLQFIAEGDRVVVLGRESVRVKSTKRAYSTEWAHSFTLRDGKISAFREYTDTNQVAAAFR
jgi:uncharacterized protein